MPLSSASTADEIVAAYRDNADYDITASRTKAGVFIQACRFILADPSRMTAGEHSLEFSTTQIAEQLNRAELWWRNSRGPISADPNNWRLRSASSLPSSTPPVPILRLYAVPRGDVLLRGCRVLHPFRGGRSPGPQSFSQRCWAS